MDGPRMEGLERGNEKKGEGLPPQWPRLHNRESGGIGGLDGTGMAGLVRSGFVRRRRGCGDSGNGGSGKEEGGK